MAVNLDDLFAGIGGRMKSAIPVWQSTMNTAPAPDPTAQAQGPSTSGGNPWAQFAQQTASRMNPYDALGSGGGRQGDPWAALASGQQGPQGSPYDAVTRGAGGTNPLAWQALSAIGAARHAVNGTANTGAFQANMSPAGTLTPEGQTWFDRAKAIGDEQGLDGNIFARQMQHESANFAPDVLNGTRVSSAKAQGIAQFMPETAKAYGVNPLDPEQALHGAARMMSDLIGQQHGDYQRALIAYNGGNDALKNWDAGTPFGESKAYIATILSQTPFGTTTGNNVMSAGEGGPSSDPNSSGGRDTQFTHELTHSQQLAACGPAAAAAGSGYSVKQATDIAIQHGLWDENVGMHGPAAQAQLMTLLGTPAQQTGVDWNMAVQQVSAGRPVVLDTPGHYFYIDAYNPQTRQYHTGTSGSDLLQFGKGGDWLTQQQIDSARVSQGPVRSMIVRG